ncbi:YIP1 family protein [Candidatus Woesearchaeota archaeon]|nr:YIP1 family protein [Candidatus Woesearchaeota archaeon]
MANKWAIADKLNNLFFHPAAFFKSVEKEKDYWPILMFFFVFSVIATLIQLVAPSPYLSQDNVPSFLIIFGFFFSIFWSFVYPFIASGIIHLGVLIFGGRNGFFNTFKPITYVQVIGIFYALLSTLILSILNTFWPIAVTPEDPLSVFTTPVFSSRLALALLISFISMVHQLVAATLGISKFQGFSRARAFVAVVLMPAILLILLGMIIGAAIVAMLAGLGNI